MPHRLRLPEVRRELLRALDGIDGPAVTTQEAAEAWNMSVETTEHILESMAGVGLVDRRWAGSGWIWWLTELALYDVTCAATP